MIDLFAGPECPHCGSTDTFVVDEDTGHAFCEDCESDFDVDPNGDPIPVSQGAHS